MYKVLASYNFSPALQRNITEIERLYGQLQVLQIPKFLLLNLERDNLVQSSFSSNSIEGNPLSKAEVTNLLLSDRVAVNRDEQEVSNYFSILKELDDWKDEEITVDRILAIHRKLLDKVDDDIKGKIRDKSVVVGHHDESGNVVIKHEPPSHDKEEIKESLEKLTWYADNAPDLAMIAAGIYHHNFVYIHPFEDGNGRVCRLSTALMLLGLGYEINKYFVLDDYYDLDRELYSNMLHSADSGDATQWLEYFTEGVKFSMQSALSRIESGLSRIEVDLRPSRREKEVLDYAREVREVTSSDIAEEFEVSRQQAFNLLKSLTEKGYLEQIGEKKGSYYRLI